MSIFSLRKSSPQSPAAESAASTPAPPKVSAAHASHPLDALTGGAFSAATSGERAARVREWLASEPALEQMNEVWKELSHRDRGAAKPLKEKLDEIKRQKSQEQIGVEWGHKAQALLGHSRLNLADALAWQRDAARAGAPLSREPLAALKQALSERVRAIEDLQHRVQVEREAAVLLAQRIEVLSTKSWREAQHSALSLHEDVTHWQQQASTLTTDEQWPSVDVKFLSMLETSRSQLQLVWDAFSAALAQALAAAAHAQAPLPAVPVWADELRAARGMDAALPAEKAAHDAQAAQERRARSAAELGRVIAALERELAEGHGKATQRATAEVRAVLKSQGRQLSVEQEARAQAVLAQAGELEGWQRWRADQLREELVTKAESLLQAAPGQRLGGRKIQEILRSLREQWKTTDQGGPPNHALWKRFDDACNEAYKEVEAWLAQVRQQTQAHRAERLAIIDEIKAWTAAHAQSTDWRAQVRELQAFSERWRAAGHLSEKAFADIQPLWKDCLGAAHARLQAAQAENTARRLELIEEARALGEQAPPRMLDAVRSLQQRWQAQASAVPLERKHEQKLWEAFRQPIDEAFARKSSEREKSVAAPSAHEQRVLDASCALEAASADGDAQRIRAAMAALDAALAGQLEPLAAVAPAAAPKHELAGQAEPAPPAAAPAPVPKKVLAVRGDDRPGMKKTEPAGRDGRQGGAPGRSDARAGRDVRGPAAATPLRDQRDWREDREARAPRLGDAAFRAQRQAIELAQASLRRLAAQAHGEALTDFLAAWEQRDAERLPTAQAFGPRLSPALRSSWAEALSKSAGALPIEALLRLEMAAELPTPAEHLSERRFLQLQLLTRRHAPSPAETWGEDVARLLACGFDAAAARRLQNALKVLLKR